MRSRFAFRREIFPDVSQSDDPSGEPLARRDARTLLFRSSIGTIVEWYDFFVFASAAALVFDRTFFPRADPLVGVLLSLMTYAVGFLTRPIGGIVFGIVGDRHGRKRALVWSLALMGVATVGVGLVPGYDRIGIAAPALLVALRLVQGLAVGGEVGGALLLVAESLPPARRGYWSAWPMIGGPAGNLLSAGALAGLALVLGETAFADWGWRLAFIASGALIGVGVWIRTRVEESPVYRAYRARHEGEPTPVLGATLAAHWRGVLTVLLVKAGENALFYVFTTFYVVYVTRVLREPRALALAATSIASVADIIAIFGAGVWSDRIGRRPVIATGLVAAAAWAFVLFPTSVRYTGFSLGYQMASVISGAVAPLVGVALLNAYGSTIPVSLYAAAMTGPALVCLGFPEHVAGHVVDGAVPES